ncbi:MAG: hypothetical protein HY996_08215 [Micrococcales bacterium]|nr:hypothetical protein [Micrococcales bacterium]
MRCSSDSVRRSRSRRWPSRSAPGAGGSPVDERELDALVGRARVGTVRPVVLIDGRSGAGKTALAHALAPRLHAQLVSLDDLYPGWDGLEAGALAVPRDVLRDDEPGWRRWDWTAQRPAEWHPLDPSLPLVVEGCGALGAASRARASLAVWLELDGARRKRRALARDGGAYAPHWERWAAQEERWIAREHPVALADVVLDGRVIPVQAQPSSCSSSSSMP